MPGATFWTQYLKPAIQMSTGGILIPPTAPTVLPPIFFACLAASTPTRQPDSFAMYVRPSTFFWNAGRTLPFLSANGAVCTV